MKASTLGPLLVGLIIAIISGYFFDLPNGDTKTFAIKIIVIPLFVLLLSKLRK